VVSISDFERIDTGHYHACGQRTNGSLSCWGFNTTGQLGNGSTTNSPTPVPVMPF
jgi:alpha-tubulin suppressor-like RCC1 family protein